MYHASDGVTYFTQDRATCWHSQQVPRICKETKMSKLIVSHLQNLIVSLKLIHGHPDRNTDRWTPSWMFFVPCRLHANDWNGEPPVPATVRLQNVSSVSVFVKITPLKASTGKPNKLHLFWVQKFLLLVSWCRRRAVLAKTWQSLGGLCARRFRGLPPTLATYKAQHIHRISAYYYGVSVELTGTYTLRSQVLCSVVMFSIWSPIELWRTVHFSTLLAVQHTYTYEGISHQTSRG